MHKTFLHFLGYLSILDKNCKNNETGYPAFAIILYDVLAGHAADGELMRYFLEMCDVVYLLGAVRNGSR